MRPASQPLASRISARPRRQWTRASAFLMQRELPLTPLRTRCAPVAKYEQGSLPREGIDAGPYQTQTELEEP